MTEVLPGVHWVGAIDWSVRIFHGYHTDEGSSYNAYLLRSTEEEYVLIDTVKAAFAEELFERVCQICAPEKLAYIIMNHAENDHSGALPLVIDRFPNAVIVTNEICRQNLCRIHQTLSRCKFKIVSDKTELKLQNMSFCFVPVPLLHWPDSMMTYCPDLKTLFSNDGFGQHIACPERYVDQFGDEQSRIIELLREYNANILGPFQDQAKIAVKKLAGVEVQTILPAHGVGGRGPDVGVAVREYANFAQREQTGNELTIIFQSTSGATRRIADALAQTVDLKIHYADLDFTDLTKCALYAYTSRFLAFGSPTIRGAMTPRVEAAIHYLRGLNLIQGRQVLLFGAYGWAEKSVRTMAQLVADAGGECVGQKTVKLKPDNQWIREFEQEAQTVFRTV